MRSHWERLSAAAIEFCTQDDVINGLRHEAGKCEFAEPPDPVNGERGFPACRYSEWPEDEYCDSCKTRKANVATYKAALRSRGNAKRRMLAAFRDLRDSGAVL